MHLDRQKNEDPRILSQWLRGILEESTGKWAVVDEDEG
jgi:hypothetical protein